jgi:hypothetical protein
MKLTDRCEVTSGKLEGSLQVTITGEQVVVAVACSASHGMRLLVRVMQVVREMLERLTFAQRYVKRAIKCAKLDVASRRGKLSYSYTEEEMRMLRESHGEAHEKKHTHPTVFKLLIAAVRKLGDPTVGLYLEGAGVWTFDAFRILPADSKGERLPDALFFKHPKPLEVAFGPCMQLNALLPVELKWRLSDTRRRDALGGLRRDMGYAIRCNGLERALRPFVGMASDGIKFLFVRMQLKFDSEGDVVELMEEEEGTKQVETKQDVADLAPVMSHIVVKLREAMCPETGDWHSFFGDGQLVLEEKEYEIVRLVAATIVTCVLEVRDVSAGERQLMVIRQRARRLPELSCLNDCEEYCELAQRTVERGDMVVYVHDRVGLRSLSSWCLCDPSDRVSVANAVWKAFEHVFARLHPKGWVLGDIHPGNVVMQQQEGEVSAHLIDFETVTNVAEEQGTMDTTRVLRRKMFQPVEWDKGGPKKPSAQTDMESAVFVIAWILDVERFRTQYRYVKADDQNLITPKERILRRLNGEISMEAIQNLV